MRRLALCVLLAALALAAGCIDAPDLDPEVDRGVELSREGRHDEAIEHYTQAIRSNPDDAYAYLFRARAYRELGRCDDGIRDATTAIELGIEYSDWVGLPYHIRSQCYQSLDQYEEAIEDATSAIELQPDEARYHLRRAVVYMEIGDEGHALMDFQTAKELDPDLEREIREIREEMEDREGE